MENVRHPSEQPLRFDLLIKHKLKISHWTYLFLLYEVEILPREVTFLVS